MMLEQIGHIKFLPWWQLGFSVTRPFLSAKGVACPLIDFFSRGQCLKGCNVSFAVSQIEDCLELNFTSPGSGPKN